MKQSLKDLLEEQLRDLYDAAIQFRQTLPDMINACTSDELRQFLTAMQEDNSETILGVEEACDLLQTAPDGITCEAMDGLIREARRSTDETGDSATIDAAIIANAQRIAHYEIAGFGTGSAFAKALKLKEVAALLSDVAERAGRHDQRLTQIAIGGWFVPGINDEAAA